MLNMDKINADSNGISRRTTLLALGAGALVVGGGFLLGDSQRRENEELEKNPPLVETHLHSDCAHSPKSLFKRAKYIYGVETIEELAKIVQAPHASDWDTWYQHLKKVRLAYTSAQMIADLIGDVIEENSEQGIDLLELRVSLLSTTATLLKNQGITNPKPQQYWQTARQIMDAVMETIRQKNDSLEMQTDFIMSISSSNKYKKYVADLMKLCLDYHEYICAMGITNEKDTPPSELGKHVDKVRHDIRGLTVHCMELMGPERGYDVLNINPDRIGHGKNAFKDPKLMAEFARRGIPFEVCLHSNLVSGVVKKLEDHPLRTFDDAGIPIILATDGTNDGKDLAYNHALARKLGCTDADLLRFRQNAHNHAFRNLYS